MPLPSTQFATNRRSSLLHTLMLSLALGASAVSASAQGHGGPPGGGMAPRDAGMKGQSDGGFGRNLMNNTTRPVAPAPSLESQGGLQLGPPGRWWDNKDFARTIGLNSLQQKHMDDVFGANRDTLLKLNKSLMHEQGQLEKLTRSRELDENQIFQQIDRVTSARGELEKAYAHMQLLIRKEMTPQQMGKMDEMLPPPTPQP